ncbi:MAG: NADH:flavin oxidoreductase/NADH oxidase family protein [Acidobacteria bacterium]|nr:NADH:flavin oxidoreductase/NADH oxidase family protein [Acidobacteriota bacterium]
MWENSLPISEILGRSLELPCKAVIKNRFCKSAMSEALGTKDHAPTSMLTRLYGRWAKGGIGLCITGNVMIDKNALGEPKNVVIEDESQMEALSRWAQAGRENGTHVWPQLNHPGKQSPNTLSQEPVAPSAVGFLSPLSHFFNPPRALFEQEIEEIIGRFARTAGIVKKAGFTGVQIHGAHGYLISQFLSPLHNRRNDKWGGPIENRMRFVREIYKAIRRKVGNAFPVGIKLNSSDFMKGGFSAEESAIVVMALAEDGIDLIELSGGTYEKPAMTGKTGPGKIKDAEAYFIEHAGHIRESVSTPIVITGGFRTGRAMAQAVDEGLVDMVGLARPMAVDPDLPEKILSGEEYISSVHPLSTGIRAINRMALLEITWYEQQLRYLAHGKAPRPNRSVWLSFMKTLFENGAQVFRKRRA